MSHEPRCRVPRVIWIYTAVVVDSIQFNTLTKIRLLLLLLFCVVVRVSLFDVREYLGGILRSEFKE
jgi:hypothetical protein